MLADNSTRRFFLICDTIFLERGERMNQRIMKFLAQSQSQLQFVSKCESASEAWGPQCFKRIPCEQALRAGGLGGGGVGS